NWQKLIRGLTSTRKSGKRRPGLNLAYLQWLLVCLANGNLPTYPPRLSPKQVRTLPRRFRRNSSIIRQLLELQPSLRELGDFGSLPGLLKGLSNAIEQLNCYGPKRRHTP